MFAAISPLILLVALMVLFVWNKWRYDLVALMGLLTAVFLGIVDADQAFIGFAHPAVVLVAAALVISHGLQSSGALQAILGDLPVTGKPLWAQLFMICGITMVLSAFINNVAAVALMIPFVMATAYQADRSPKLYLMPVAFSSLLGGQLTMIGTPPNIIIATYRAKALDETPFTMFDFTPVGIGLSIAGLVFIAFVSRFFVRVAGSTSADSLRVPLRDFLTEVEILADGKLVGMTMAELSEKFSDLEILTLRRGEHSIVVSAPFERLKAGDKLVIEGVSAEIENFVASGDAKLVTDDKGTSMVSDDNITVLEVVVPWSSTSIGLTPKKLDIRWKYGVNVVGVARSGESIHRRLRDVVFHVGDILLLQGSKEQILAMVKDCGFVYLAERSSLFSRKRAVLLPIGIFATAIVANFLGLVDVTVAFVSCALAFTLLGYVSFKDVYTKIEWPVIVLLAALIPVGQALETSGSLALVVKGFMHIGSVSGPIVVLGLIMAATMMLTNVINNAAAAIVMAPVAMTLATQLEVSVDTLLMGVAVAASAAFVTPIAHQSNAIVMGPGGYSFKEYSYLGLPLSVLTLGLSIPLILIFWPLR